METKICSMCGESKPLGMFPETSKHVSYKTMSQKNRPTHEGRCRPCKAAAAREWRKRNPGYNGTGEFKRIPQEERLLRSAISERLTQAKTRAKQYNQPDVTVDKDYLYQLFKDQQGRCALSGVLMKVEKGAVACLSLDKIRPGEGYVPGNVQWVAWAVNRAKGDMNEDVFLDMCRQILEYQKVQRLSLRGVPSSEGKRGTPVNAG